MTALAILHAGAHELTTDAPGWTVSPSVTMPLLLAALLYGAGYARLSARSGASLERRRDALLFALGWSILAASLVSPLHQAGERSFTLHMIEHEMIMIPAAWAMAASRPLGVMLWGVPKRLRPIFAGGARWWQALADPVTATGLQALMLIVWHAPPLFDRALGHETWHVAQHLSFLLSALLFWHSMTRASAGALVAATCLFVTSLIGGGLGALMAFAHSPWYAGYAALGLMPLGLTPTQDQQLAGLIMWIPGGMAHAGAALLLLARFLGARERADAFR